MNIRKAALRLLDEWEADGKYINLAISSHFLDGLSPAERAALTALVYTAVERKITYDYYISAISKRSTDKISPAVLNILRLGICQIVDMTSVPDFAAVNESVKLAKHQGERSFINGVLRTAVRMKEDGTLPLPPYEKNKQRYYSVKYSLPLWIVKKFMSDFPEDEAVRLFESFNAERDTDITVNTLKISREELLSAFKEQGINAELGKLSPLSVKVKSHINPRELYGYREGLFFVQDEASSLSALALAPTAGERIMDACAAPGGKSLAAAVLTEDKAEIRAYDLRESKLSLILASAGRLGFKSLKVACRDAALVEEELVGFFDKIICDVPCSGLGVIAKKPDLRHRSEESISELPELQLSILTASSVHLKPGGTIVYSTCTLSRDENENVVLEFLRRNPEFSIENFEIGSLKSTDGMLTLYPHIHGSDGFFIAKIKKNA